MLDLILKVCSNLNHSLMSEALKVFISICWNLDAFLLVASFFYSRCEAVLSGIHFITENFGILRMLQYIRIESFQGNLFIDVPIFRINHFYKIILFSSESTALRSIVQQRGVRLIFVQNAKQNVEGDLIWKDKVLVPGTSLNLEKLSPMLCLEKRKIKVPKKFLVPE